MSDHEAAPVPSTIGPFRVLRAIASGGMAEVYEVQDPRSGERYALKLLIAVKTALQRFNREYEAMTRLNHPGIVRVYHYGLHDGHPWFTMELLEGSPAQPWVKDVGKPGSATRTREVLRLGHHLARALDYAHQRGLIHRDIKSANVLVLPDGRVKLVDFGTAHLADASRQITNEGEFVGTYAYASPEQISGKPVDHRSDLYSLGVLLFRLATGRRPFGATDPAELARAHVSVAAPDARALTPSLPPAFAELVGTMMAKQPGQRPRTAGQVAAALQQIAGERFPLTSPLALHHQQCTGRELERRRIQRTLDAEPGAAVVVVGEPGSDRARVVDAVLQDRIERQHRVFLCTLTPGRDVNALLGMLKTMGRQGADERNAVRSLRRLARANATQLAVTRVRVGLRNSVLGTLESLLGNAPVVIGVHGLEHASPLTLEVLAGVRASARELQLPVALLADCAPRALRPGSELARRLPDLVRVDLQPLDPTHIALAVGRMLGRRPPPAELATKLQLVTDGQPAYVEEAVRDLVAQGALEADEGNRLEWAAGDVAFLLPATARRDAEAVLAGLPHLHRRLLELASLADEQIPIGLLADALGWTAAEVELALVELVERQILLRDGDTLRWRVGRLRALLRDELRPERERAHSACLARALRDAPPTPAQIRLLLENDDAALAHARCVPVARQALAAGDYQRAHDVLQPVIEQTRAQPLPERGEIHLLFARCLQVMRPMDPRATRALSVARKTMGGRPEHIAELDLSSAQLAEGIGHTQIFAKHLDAAWAAASTSGDAALQHGVALELASLARRRGQLRSCERWTQQALDCAAKVGDAAVAWAKLQAAELALRRAELARCLELTAEADTLFQATDHALGRWAVAATWGAVERRLGRFSDALERLQSATPAARRAQDPSIYLRLLLTSAWCELELCRLGKAQELLDEVAATLRRGERPALRIEAMLANGRLLLASGLLEQAEWTLAQTHERAKKAELFVLAEAARALWAETVWATGRHERGDELFRAALLGLKGLGDRVALIDGVIGRGRAAGKELDVEAQFRPLLELHQAEGLPVVHLEHLLTRLRVAAARGDRGALAARARDAALALNQLSARLNDTDRAALRVHPWSTTIRRALEARPGVGLAE